MVRTVHRLKTIYAEAVLDEKCPAEACLYSLKDFLSLIARSENLLELTFDTTASGDFPQGCATIQEVGTQHMIGSVGLCDPAYVRRPPSQPLRVESDIAFDLTAGDLAYLTTQPHKHMKTIMIRSSGNAVRLQKMIYEDFILGYIEVGNRVTDTAPFQGALKTEYLKCLMPGPYSVHIAQKGIAHFLYKGFPLEYWMMVEK